MWQPTIRHDSWLVGGADLRARSSADGGEGSREQRGCPAKLPLRTLTCHNGGRCGRFRLSHRQVGEMLGLDYWQAEAFLKGRGVPLNYSAADLEADHATLDKILAPL